VAQLRGDLLFVMIWISIGSRTGFSDSLALLDRSKMFVSMIMQKVIGRFG